MQTFRVLLLTSFLLAACAPVAAPEDEPSSPGMENSAEGADDTGGNGETGAAMESSSAAVTRGRIVEITASNFAFTPNMITVKKGEKVTLNLVGESGIHGIGIPGLGISQRVDLGANVSIALPTDTAGTFDFQCNVPCGPGHKEMKGTIVIEE